MKKIVLSYSTINMVYRASHNWVNKREKVEKPERPEWKEGKDNHRILQDHLSTVFSGRDPKLAYLKVGNEPLYFPVVETQDYDPKCGFFLNIDKKYAIRGFADGLNKREKRVLEIKTSASGPWSIGKYDQSMQRKCYALGFPWAKESILITGYRDPLKWETNPLKVGRIDYTDKDREDAMKWILEGIEIIESGDYTGGLDEEGRCTDRWCDYGVNCLFK
jgi:hypothetical protein